MTPVLKRIHHVEFAVGNAKQAAFFYRTAFGFDQVAYRGPETGCRDRASYALRQGDIFLVLTTPLRHDDPLSVWLMMHGDGVCDIAFEVDDAAGAHAQSVAAGAVSLRAPAVQTDAAGSVTTAAIRTYGEVAHTFIQRGGYRGFLPGFEKREIKGKPTGLTCIDHIVGNVADDDKDISTEFSALRSVVVAAPNNVIKFPINEPAPGKRKSQIQEYVESYRRRRAAPGLPDQRHRGHHRRDAQRGVDFLEVPVTYYETVWDRVGPSTRTWPCSEKPEDPHRPRRQGLPAAALQPARAGPAHAVHRDHPAQGQRKLRQGQLQGPLRIHRACAGRPRQPVGDTMPFYHRLGRLPQKRHTVFKRPDGTLYQEEVMGNKGFSGLASILYHERMPTMIRSARVLKELRLEEDPDPTLRHAPPALRAHRLAKGSVVLDRVPVLLFNDEMALSIVVTPDRRLLLPQRRADEVLYVSQRLRRAGASSASWPTARGITW
jgi:4-hydroxyphenylpyruvate dioxygenase